MIILLTARAIVSVVSAFFAVALVLHEGPRQEAARGLGAAFGAWGYLMAYSGVTMLFRPDAGFWRDLFEGHFLLVEVIGLASLLRFTTLFPRTLVADEIPPSSTPPVLRPAHAVSLWMLRPTAPWSVGLLVLVGLWTWAVTSGGSVGDAGLSPAMDLVRFGAAGLVVLNLRRAWRLTRGGDRDGLTWLVAGLSALLGSLALLIGGNVLVAVTGFPEPNVAWRPILLDMGLIGFLAGLAMSVLYSGALHPMTVVRWIAATCAVTTAGLFLAAGLEALFAGGILAGYSLRTGVGTAIAAATIVSTYRNLVRLVGRLLPQP